MTRSYMMPRPGVFGVAALAAALACAFSVSAIGQTKWHLPGAYPADNPHTQNLVQFAKDVETVTGGRISITVHPGASLFKGPEIKRAVQSGQAQLGGVLLSIHENEDPIFGLDVVPFLATSFPDARRLYRASKPMIERKLETQGLKLLFMVPWPPQGIYSKKALSNVDDMKGLRWRAYNVGTSRIGELLGMQPVTIQHAELPQALATGVVNTFMSSGSIGYDSKIWEILPYFYDVQAWIPKDSALMNKAAFDALNKTDQDVILAAAAAAEDRGWKSLEEKSSWYLDQLRAKGMKVEPPSPELAAGFRKIGETLTTDWLKKAGPEGQNVIDEYKKMPLVR